MSENNQVISRRKLLASMGAAGAGAMLLGASVIHAGAASKTVTDAVYGGNTNNDSLMTASSIASADWIVTTIAGVRSETSPTAGSVYYVTDEGQEGPYAYDSTDTTSADDTGLVLVSTSGARFKRIHGDIPINVKWYGAKGDGVTDDTAAINAAIGNGGVTVWVPPGTYMISGEYSQGSGDTAGVQLQDDTTLIISSGATLKQKPASTERYLVVGVFGKNNVVIEGGGMVAGDRLEHTGSGGEHGFGINIGGSTNVLVQDLNLIDCWGDGIQVANFNGVDSRFVTLRKLHCDNNRRQGLSIESAQDVLIQDSYFLNTNGTAPQYGIDLEPSSTSQLVARVTISGCVFDNNAGGAVSVTGQFGPVEKVVLESNRFLGTGYTGMVYSHNSDEVIIRNNLFNSPMVASDDLSYQLRLAGVTNHLIEGNVFSESVYRCILAKNSSGVQIVGNQFVNIAETGAEIAVHFQGSQNCMFDSNLMDECSAVFVQFETGSDGVTKSSFNTVQNNTLRNRLKLAGIAASATSNTIGLGADASSTDDEYSGMIIIITDNTGVGQRRQITDYNGATKIATVDSNWTVTPDSSTNTTLQSHFEVRTGVTNAIRVIANQRYNVIQNNNLLFATKSPTASGIDDSGTGTVIANNISF